MKKETITAILQAQGLKAGSDGFDVPPERHAACMIRTPGDTVVVQSVCRFALQADFVELINDKDERFFFAHEDVLGIRMNTKGKEGTAGFGRP